MREVIIVLVVLMVVGIVEALLQLSRYLEDRKLETMRRRLRNLGTGAQPIAGSLLRQGKLSSIAALDAILRAFPLAVRLETLLVEADIASTVAQLFGISMVLALAGGTLATALSGGMPAVVALAVIGFFIPYLVIIVIRDRRSAKISEQLPDALDMMARALRTGHAVSNSFQFVAAEMPEPINLEFGRAYEEQRLGRTLDKAVLEMTRRVPKNQDLKILAVSLVVQKETGGNLTEILENIAETIRSRYRFFGKLRSLTAEGRMSGLVLASLPLLMIAFLGLSNPTYLRPLFHEPLGWALLAYAGLSWGIGLLWMFSMTRVEF
ncbi:MAG: hypothetical protein A2289_16100 [Deltaproteobacteria bacterium RIFOXYA12_FULL_58_15]|nr:MAG: hypothetical protein A2289_16100 [Deltaproteobacteria bacterium RIFOXYA12_FULL_58_15]OGR10070.1 MAG: hypothetical protein A2341_10620 [Deltaproteobacteria bacterium RIFOXYB12_FULL_58_9]